MDAVNVKTPESVLIIGSGPIVIGQAAEFDYAGTQACKAMAEEGVRSILVNSNPATIMTDEGVADAVYIEPLTVPVLRRIIEKERPESLLPTLGGQVGLNLAVELQDAGVLDEFNVRVLGTQLDGIRRAEDRQLFREAMREIGEPTPPSAIANSMEEAREAIAEIGLPVAIRPAYTLGGTGGGFVRTMEEFERVVQTGLDASPISQVLVERSLLGWKEVEYEVMRDAADTCITICNMENLDPMGVHTGDSIVVAPSQTLSDKDYHMLRSASLNIIRSLGIEGGCNVQLALAPRQDVVAWPAESVRDGGGVGVPHDEPLPYYVIEVNPRVSRSSALASKATGYPIARVAAKIAAGKRLDEIPNQVTGRTQAAFEPALDYCVVKIPRWPFDKFEAGDRVLGTQMKATGEVMAIDRTFEAALQKAIRSLEFGGRTVLWEDAEVEHEPMLGAETPTDIRLWHLLAAVRADIPLDEIAQRSGVDPWFLERLQTLVHMERRLLAEPLSPDLMRQAKRMGFADEQIANLAGSVDERIREQRLSWGIAPVYKMVDTCAAEFDAVTPYFYSTYEDENEAVPEQGNRALVVGSGPIRIGQGIEFDYASVKAAQALRAAGWGAVMANSNPETVSTDFDTSDRLYFEPLDEEAVRDILQNEDSGLNGNGGPQGEVASILQFGGQTAINLAGPLTTAARPILGSSAEVIDLAEDRRRFERFLADLGIPQPPGTAVNSVDEAVLAADAIGYPVLVRPSYVLGGRAMEIVQGVGDLARYVTQAQAAAPGKPILIDKYLAGIEVEVDAICGGPGDDAVLIPGVMEHIERAGVHSGDSMAVYPAPNLRAGEVATLIEYTRQIGNGLGVTGLMNIQYVIMREADDVDGDVFVLEVNPRASRTVPFLSKVTGVPMVEVAVRAMLGESLSEQGFSSGLWPPTPLVAVKAPVFSMSKLSGVDTHLGPEMKSTGEVMGVDIDYDKALNKALIAAGMAVPPRGRALLSIADQDKPGAMALIRELGEAGYELHATVGTASLIRGLGYEAHEAPKREVGGDPDVIDLIRSGQIDMVINTPEQISSNIRDGFHIRRAAAEQRIPCFTSIDTAHHAVGAMLEGGADYNIAPLPDYTAGRV
ncbi:MAG: carbamoyl-phosphate synthase large subunit [Chloroflexota bacterium]|nr:carbamoyl-phosphate synthase large subunit [Chloroflexota bacterium]MDE2894999.1 carbamoyl-phosphate synthase large subunit [Chloroflexota bacterium]